MTHNQVVGIDDKFDRITPLEKKTGTKQKGIETTSFIHSQLIEREFLTRIELFKSRPR